MRFLGTLLVVGLVSTSETTPPSVALTAPTGGTIGAWTPTLIAEASDDSGVSHVEFFVDGASLGTATTSPYRVTWDARGAASGAHTLTAVATDLHGNTATSSPVTLMVDLAPPSVAFTSPTPGATLGGVIPLRLDATDDAGITHVEYGLDGSWLANVITPPYSLDFDSGAEADGPHTLTVTAHDMLGHSTTSTVTVNTQQPVSAEYDPGLKTPLCATPTPLCDTTNRVRGQRETEPHAPNTLWASCDENPAPYPGRALSRLKVSTLSGAPLAAGERVRLEVHVRLQDASANRVDLFTTSTVNPPAWTWLATLQPDSHVYGRQVLSTEYVLPPGKLQAVRAQLRMWYDTASPCSSSTYADRDDVAFAVDTPPQVRLTTPVNTARLEGVVSLNAEADASHPVTKVEFYDGTTLLGTDTSAPYRLSWDTASAADGAHTVFAKAYDTAGREGTSATVQVTTDNNPPDVALVSPTQGTFVRGWVELEATATDTVSSYIPKLEFYEGTTLLGTTESPTGRSWWSWNTGSVMDGLHTLTVKAYDRMGHVGTSTPVEVSVDNTVPTVALTAPPAQSGTHVRGLLQLSATASDNLGLARVEFHRDGSTLLGTVTRAPYELSWDSASAVDGSHRFSVTAYDHAGNAAYSGSSSVTVDNTPPTAALASPTQGAFLRGTVTLQSAASDNLGVTRLEFYDGATLLGTDTTAPYSMSWNTVGAAEGPHTLTVRAHDKAGNVHTSAAVGVSIDNVAPTTALGAPAQNAWLRGTVPVSATASDNQAVARVEFHAGTTLLGTVTTAPYEVSWDTAAGPDGGVTLTTRAYDAAGNVTVSAGRAVNVDNSAPTVAITSPANGASLFLSTTLQASASDNVGVTHVVFYDGTKVLGTDTTAPYSMSWNLLSVSKGTHTLTARAYDALGNEAISAPVSVTVR